MEINTIIEGVCQGLTHDGQGIIKTEDGVIFVPNLLPDEAAKVKITYSNKKFANGRVLEIKNESKERVKPVCKVFGVCGGCDLLHMNYKYTLQFKKNMVEETLKRIGHLDALPEITILGSEEPLFYRNKVQIPLAVQNGKTICGFYRRKTHECIKLEQCFIQPQISTDIAILVKNLMIEFDIEPYDETTKKGNVRHILIRNNSQGEYLVVLITRKQEIKNASEIVAKITKRYPEVIGIVQNINPSDNNVILGRHYSVLYGKDELIEEILGVKYRLSHKSFFQVNHAQTTKLYSLVLDFLALKPNDVVIDAYCGVGSISLLLAKTAKRVYGVEIVKDAIEDAKYNKQLNDIKNATFYVGEAEAMISELIEKKANCLVVDPPRKGCDEKLINAVLDSTLKKIVYVSCDPATLARDLALLKAKYEIKKISCVDMFCYASHVECVCLMTRNAK